MNLIKTSLLNGIAVVIRLFTSIGLNKVLALYVGPAGYAVIGQFQNAMGMLTSFASAGITTGVTKYTAEYFDDEEQQHTVWRTAGTIVFCGSLFASLGIALFHRSLARMFLKDEAYAGVFLWLAATLILMVFNGLLLAILNGKKDIRRYVTVNITGSLVSLIVTGILAKVWGLYGALVALAINQSIVFIVTFAMCQRAAWFRVAHIIGPIDLIAARNLGKFMLMALTTAAVGPTSQIIVRDHLATKFGWTSAGHWQAVTKISDIYLMLITTTLSVYYLPKLSEIRDITEIKKEILRGYKLILPLTVSGASIIYLLRDWIVEILFTKDFYPMTELFAWQLSGDVVKICSWLLAYVMLGRALVRTFIFTEILFGTTFIGFTFVFTKYVGLKGATVGYFINYVVYWITMIYLIPKFINGRRHISAI
ncbi:polysaccharide biosynthesis protein [Geobacter metallireducens RCH3]|uniref:Undecaprenyl-diphospho-oligosaccharide flippase n=1 Tax=Geobacter metallireducens (strain ATCC 53774 / DSM 7210 / GS-15) TaxID=269799 RepID=Q39W13_GEOMG|nr:MULTISPECIES: O-antigen translocase [Geobacter]ABB31561.1 undecaprenyl-diphospho-oligosaccharide flippase [Geobacter metallireducens GS-15]EHP83992.1 polysaccharide biosynthesis protein [Geobacter metallireducens RCH3]MBT1075492.1 O-antigen translocase [Geobacter grbiciae]